VRTRIGPASAGRAPDPRGISIALGAVLRENTDFLSALGVYGRSVTTRRLLVVILGACVIMLAPPAVASPTVRLSILHVVRGCHVWSTTNAPAAKITVKVRTRLEIRASCPMDFDIVQTAGPRLPLGNRRLYAGTTRVIVFRKRGLYKLSARNVQSSEQKGFQTLGSDNALTLTVVVKAR
jgi:hypothetical protein